MKPAIKTILLARTMLQPQTDARRPGQQRALLHSGSGERRRRDGATQESEADLLLLDIRLGDGSGLDVINTVRADPPSMMFRRWRSRQAMKNDEMRFLAAGFDGYLSKPVDTRRLPAIVDRFIHEGRKAGHA